MSERKTYFVQLHSVFEKGSWSMKIDVADHSIITDPAFSKMVGVEYAVEGCRKPQAIAVVMEWLARGKPRSMTVAETFRSQTSNWRNVNA